MSNEGALFGAEDTEVSLELLSEKVLAESEAEVVVLFVASFLGIVACLACCCVLSIVSSSDASLLSLVW